jgi:hypothetical protein
MVSFSAGLQLGSIADPYQTTPQNIQSIYDRELPKSATCKEYLRVRQESARRVKRSLKHDGLGMMLAVG